MRRRALAVLCLVLSFDSFARGAETKSVAAPAQIRIEFRLLEVSRTKLRQQKLQPEQEFLFRDEAKSKGSPFPFRIFDVDESAKLDQAVNAILASAGKIIVEPTLAGPNGQPLNFRAGDTLKIGLPDGSTEAREMGTSIKAVPNLQPNGDLKLDLFVRVSELQPKLDVVLGGRKFPGFRTRQFMPNVTLRSGQTFVMSGMQKERVETRKVGLIGKTQESVNEIETVLVVRPTFTTAQAKKAN
jgi:Flp pilus assembly secretin CpaC